MKADGHELGMSLQPQRVPATAPYMLHPGLLVLLVLTIVRLLIRPYIKMRTIALFYAGEFLAPRASR